MNKLINEYIPKDKGTFHNVFGGLSSLYWGHQWSSWKSLDLPEGEIGQVDRQGAHMLLFLAYIHCSIVGDNYEIAKSSIEILM